MELKTVAWTNERVRDFWNWESRHSERYFTFFYGQSILQKVSGYLPTNAKVLDFAAGPGWLFEALLKNGHPCMATDISEATVKILLNKFSGYKNFLGAVTLPKLLEEKRKFDVIFACEIVEHLDDKQLPELLGVLRTLLEPKGKIVITTPNNENLDLEDVLCPNCNSHFHRWQHVRSFSDIELKKVLTSNGFRVNLVRSTDFGLSVKVRSKKMLLKSIYSKLSGESAHPHLLAVAEIAGSN